MTTMDTLKTMDKILTVFGCEGSFMHLICGVDLLRYGKGYICPYCHMGVKDMTNTPVGQAYKDQVRPDLGLKHILPRPKA